MDKILNMIKGWIDKWPFKLDRNSALHVTCSALIVATVALVLPTFFAVAIGALIGLAKEYIYDKAMCKGVFDYKDLMWDGVGLLWGLLIALL